MEKRPILSFDIALDGTMQNIKGDIDGKLPDKKVMNRLLFAANKLLTDEEVSSITIHTDSYVLRLSAAGANFSCIVTRL